jgi:hypothetical protein
VNKQNNLRANPSEKNFQKRTSLSATHSNESKIVPYSETFSKNQQKCIEPSILNPMEIEHVSMNPTSESSAPVRQALARSATAPPSKSLPKRSLSTSPPPSAPYTTTKHFFINNNNNDDYDSKGHVHRSHQRRALNHRLMTDAGGGSGPLRPVLSQQQAEARNMMLAEIKALQLRRQGSFKRMLRLPIWGSGSLIVLVLLAWDQPQA